MNTNKIPNDMDMDIFKDDTDQLWLFANALLVSCLRGKLQHLPSAKALSSACVSTMREIEQEVPNL